MARQLADPNKRAWRRRKYRADNLMPVLRLFAKAREQALKQGFTDNGGAIHSVERVLDILAMHLRYPHLTHINQLKTDPGAEITSSAYRARQRGERLRIEHVLPQRAFAQEVCRKIRDGNTDTAVLSYIKAKYRLVLMTPEEVAVLDRTNRSRITPDRLTGITLWRRKQAA